MVDYKHYDEELLDDVGDGYQQDKKDDPLANHPEVHIYEGRLKVKLDGVHDGHRWSDWIHFEIPAIDACEAARVFNLQFSGVTTWWPSKKYGYMPWIKI